MNAFLHFLTGYIVNSLWQVPLLFAVAWLLARMLRRLGPAAEHRVWVGTLLLQLTIPACAAPRLIALLRHVLTTGRDAAGQVSYALGVAKPLETGDFSTRVVQLGTFVWIAITAIMVARFAWQLLELHRLARSAKPLTLNNVSTAWLHDCCRRFRIARVELASAATVQTPLTFGLSRPMVLLPIDFIARASTPQMHVALGHELVHVARRDATKQMLYSLVSLPLQYHPVVWFTLWRVAETRERVCDRIASSTTGGTRQYARSLLELASLLTTQRPAQSHAIGLFDANQFERRILMLNRRTLPLSRSLRIALVASSALLAVTICTSAIALHLDAPSQPTQPDRRASDQPKPNGAVRIASSVAAGQTTSKVQPVYPPEAKQAKIQGSVVLHAIIGKTGAVERLTVVSGPLELQQSALDAVHQWVYKPFLLNGEPTEVETDITINYSLSDSTESHASSAAPASADTAAGWVAPKLLSTPTPIYPQAARQAKVGGEVVVNMKIGANGKVSDVAALSGPEQLRGAALDAARQYVFTPATRNGQPVPVDLQVAIKFEVF